MTEDTTEQQFDFLMPGATDRARELSRRALVLRLEGKTYAEIGKAMGLSAHYAGQIAERAHFRMKRHAAKTAPL